MKGGAKTVRDDRRLTKKLFWTSSQTDHIGNLLTYCRNGSYNTTPLRRRVIGVPA